MAYLTELIWLINIQKVFSNENTSIYLNMEFSSDAYIRESILNKTNGQQDRLQAK